MGRKIPRYLSAPFQILWWDVDTLGIMGVFIFLAFTVHGIFWVLGPLVPYGYAKAKRRYPRGFLKHAFYFAGLSNIKGYPSFFEDRFVE